MDNTKIKWIFDGSCYCCEYFWSVFKGDMDVDELLGSKFIDVDMIKCVGTDKKNNNKYVDGYKVVINTDMGTFEYYFLMHIILMYM